MKRELQLNSEKIVLELNKKDATHVSFAWQGKSFEFELVTKTDSKIILKDQSGTLHHLVMDGSLIVGEGKDALFTTGVSVGKTSQSGGGDMTSPMPGKVFKVLVKAGENVVSGQTLMILEAMKMEHAIKASKDGVVKKILFKEGELVKGGMPLVELE